MAHKPLSTWSACLALPWTPFWASLAVHHSKGSVIGVSVTRQTTGIVHQELLHPSSWPGGYSKLPSLVTGTSHLLGQLQAGPRPKQTSAEAMGSRLKTAPDGDSNQNSPDSLENNLTITDTAHWQSLFTGSQMHSPNICRKLSYQITSCIFSSQ